MRVPHADLARPDLSDAAKIAWLALDQWAWRGAFPSNGQLAAACGWYSRTSGRPSAWKAKKALVELEGVGLVQRSTDKSQGYWQRVGIRVTRPCTVGAPPAHDDESDAPDGGAPAHQGVVLQRTRGWCAGAPGGSAPAHRSVRLFKTNQDVKVDPAGNENGNVATPPKNEEELGEGEAKVSFASQAKAEQRAAGRSAASTSPPRETTPAAPRLAKAAQAPPSVAAPGAPGAPKANACDSAPVTTAALLAKLPGKPEEVGPAAHRIASDLGDPNSVAYYSQCCREVVANPELLGKLNTAFEFAMSRKASGVDKPGAAFANSWKNFRPDKSKSTQPVHCAPRGKPVDYAAHNLLKEVAILKFDRNNHRRGVPEACTPEAAAEQFAERRARLLSDVSRQSLDVLIRAIETSDSHVMDDLQEMLRPFLELPQTDPLHVRAVEARRISGVRASIVSPNSGRSAPSECAIDPDTDPLCAPLSAEERERFRWAIPARQRELRQMLARGMVASAKQELPRAPSQNALAAAGGV